MLKNQIFDYQLEPPKTPTMNFGFQARGGTAPTLISVGYGRSVRSGRPAPSPVGLYGTCEQQPDNGDDPTGLPTAPFPCYRRQDGARQCSHHGRNGKGVTRAPMKKAARGHRGTRSGWGKRNSSNSYGVGTMLSTRPASRQALSDLTDLNLALKYDKMKMRTGGGGGRDHDTRPHSLRPSSNEWGDCTHKVPPTSPCQFASSIDGQLKGAATSPAHEQRRSSPQELHVANVSEDYAPANPCTNSDDVCGAVGLLEDPIYPPYLDGDHQDYRLHRRLNSTSSREDSTFSVRSCEQPMILRAESRSELSTSGERASRIANKGQQTKGSPFEQKIAAQATQHSLGGSGTKRGPSLTPTGIRDDIYGGATEDGRNETGDEENGADESQNTTPSPRDESSVAQSEKDQRMWSALKTSLLSEGLAPGDKPFTGLRSTDSEMTSGSASGYLSDTRERVHGDSATMNFFSHQQGMKGTRDMEQLDLERSAMDRTMRPNRAASARLLETDPSPSSPNRTRYSRHYSAGATKSRSRQNDLTISGFMVDAGGTLQCTGVRAELVPRRGEAHYTFHSSDKVGYPCIDTGMSRATSVGQREGVQQLRRKSDTGRFQWVTDDEGVANFLQRPPSRQKEAFPTHLADVVPYIAFQVEKPIRHQETKQHIEVTRKTAVEQTRPPSRHKPPAQSLFLEVPESRRHVPPSYSSHMPMANPCGGLPPGRLSIDTGDVEATTGRDGLSSIFALDRRHDDPDRDGFSVLQVQGPCPFRIEVTNSFVQPYPPTVPVGALQSSATNKGRVCPTDPVRLLFGAAKHEAGGRSSAGKQRTLVNTIPTFSGSPLISPVQSRSDTAGRSGSSGKPTRMLSSSRSSSGMTSRTIGGFNSCSCRDEDGTTLCDLPSPSPPLAMTVSRQAEGEGNGCAVGCIGWEGGMGMLAEEFAQRRVDVGAGEGILSGRGDSTVGLRVSTGAPGITVSDWSLQSCDDADDTTFLDGPTSTFGDSTGTKHTSLDTTLGQDFLSLFAPSSGPNDTSIINALNAF